jgi:hypothetical protein
MVMLVPVNESGFDTLMEQPDEINGAETQSSYFYLTNVDRHYAQAKSADADIILDMMDNDRARRGYSCRDPEGHIWHFGAFNPWPRQRVKVRPQGWPVLITCLSVCLSIILVASTLAFGFLHVAGNPQQSATRVAGWSAAYAGAAIRRLSGAAPNHEDQLFRIASSSTVQELNDALTQARVARQAAERANEESRAQIARLRLEKETAENSAWEAVGLLEKERIQRMAVERHDAKMRERANEQGRVQLEQWQTEIELARFAAREAGELLAKEKDLRLAAEHRYKEASRRAKRARHPRWRKNNYSYVSW